MLVNCLYLWYSTISGSFVSSRHAPVLQAARQIKLDGNWIRLALLNQFKSIQPLNQFEKIIPSSTIYIWRQNHVNCLMYRAFAVLLLMYFTQKLTSHKISCQSKADHPRSCIFRYACLTYLGPVTLT